MLCGGEQNELIGRGSAPGPSVYKGMLNILRSVDGLYLCTYWCPVKVKRGTKKKMRGRVYALCMHIAPTKPQTKPGKSLRRISLIWWFLRLEYSKILIESLKILAGYCSNIIYTQYTFIHLLVTCKDNEWTFLFYVRSLCVFLFFKKVILTLLLIKPIDCN